MVAVTQLLPPSVPTLGSLVSLKHSTEPCAENLPGAGLVTCRRTVHVSWIEVVEFTVPQQPRTATRHTHTHTHTHKPLGVQISSIPGNANKIQCRPPSPVYLKSYSHKKL